MQKLAETELREERALVEAAQRDLRRFDVLYDRYFNRVYAYAVSRVRERALAEDVTSETFRRALQALPRFRWLDVPFSAWLFRIAANMCVDVMKQSGAKPLTLTLSPEGRGNSHFLMADSAADPGWERDVERRASLYDAVDALPPEQRNVLVLRFVQDRSIRETAAALSKTEGAVKQLQIRAIRTLRTRLVNDDE